MALQQLLLKAFKDKVAEGTVEMEDENHEFYNAAEGDDDHIQNSDFFDRLAMVEGTDWRIYEIIVSAAADEFNGKFKRCGQ